MTKVEIVGVTKYSKETVSKAVGKAVETRLVDLNQTIQKLRDAIGSFESKYSMDTDGFLKRYDVGELNEDLDFMEWKACKEILDDLTKEKEMLLEIKQ